MKLKWLVLNLGIFFSFQAIADGFSIGETTYDQPWSVTASLGGGKYPQTNDKAAIARLALGDEVLLAGDYAVGLELGVQNGNHLHVNIPKETLAIIEWLPVRTSLGPMLDLLITAKSDPLAGSSFFAQLKGGIAYRYWQLKQEKGTDLSQLTGEIQAGFGYPISAIATLNLLYQGIYGGEPNFVVNTNTQSTQASNIPSLHAVLVGFSVNL